MLNIVVTVFYLNMLFTIKIVSKSNCITTLRIFIAKPNIKVHVRNKSQGA